MLLLLLPVLLWADPLAEQKQEGQSFAWVQFERLKNSTRAKLVTGDFGQTTFDLFPPAENCGNGIDDDGDGLVDADDPDCGGDVMKIIPTGSFIINMGVQPQTVNNALKPYGLVWHLLHDFQVPVFWSINPDKTKDGIDFTYNGTSYRGGPFIISADYRTPEVNALIQTWQAKGVVGVTTTSEFTAPINRILSYSMNWTLNKTNGSIAKAYLDRAEIPETAYDWTLPNELDCCHDVYLMPHSEPTWITHNRLFFWNDSPANGGCSGALWAGCKAGSVVENIKNPVSPNQRMNFLMLDPIAPQTNPAVPDGSHKDGSIPPPYTYGFPAHPVMQFLGTMDGAQENGAEQIYLPTNGWRPSTFVGTWDDTHLNVPSLSPGKAAKMAFGPAFGDPSRGAVMYEAGHRLDRSTAPANIAAQRAFFNFSFFAAGQRAIHTATNLEAVMEGGDPYILTATATGGSGNYVFEWSSTCGGTFSNPFSSTTTFTAPESNTSLNCFVRVTVTDDCGTRTGFDLRLIRVQGRPAPPVAVNDSDATQPGTPVTINALANDSDPNDDPLTLSGFIGSANTGNGIFVNNGDGTVTYTPSFSFVGSDQIQYAVCDNTAPASGGPLCDTATITVTVNWNDVNGCYPNEYHGIVAQGNAIAMTAQNSTTNPSQALGVPVLVPSSSAYYAKLDNNSDYLVLDLGYDVPEGDTIYLHIGSDDASISTLEVRGTLTSTNYATGVGFYDLQTYSTNKDLNDANPQEDVVAYVPVTVPVRRLRFNRSTGANKPCINGLRYVVRECLSAEPVANDDAVTLCEDNTVDINVLANDSDPRGLTLTASLETLPLHGVATLLSGGSIRYKPNADYSGADVLTYQVCNTAGLCVSATVNITVYDDNCPPGYYKISVGGSCSGNCILSPYHPPVALNDIATTTSNTPVNIPVQNNDSDPGGLGLTMTLVSSNPPDNGTVNISGVEITYTPDAGFSAADTFAYSICNVYGCDTAIVIVDVFCALPGAGNAIGGNVFSDVNVNATLDNGETGVANVEVKLFNDTDQNGVFSANDQLLDSVTTDSQGHYVFNVPAVNNNPAYRLTRQVQLSSDDAEQSLTTGATNLTSSDLELINDSGTNQKVGIRFQNITIPKGASILRAYLEFTNYPSNPPESGATTLIFAAENSDNAATFTTATNNISSRPETSATVTWSMAAGTTWGADGNKHQTPDLTSIIQQVINRSGWASGNSLAILVRGSGERSAYAFDSSPANAAKLVIEYAPATSSGPAGITSPLAWHTFQGGGLSDNNNGVATDNSGNVYIAGKSGFTWGTPVRAYSDGDDGYVAKYNSNGSLIWNTFLGGNNGLINDYCYGVTVDNNGNVYVAGLSIATWGTPIRAFTGGWDSFVAKLDSNGNLLWHTFLGGAGTETVQNIALDASGNVYVTGSSSTTWGTPVRGFTSSGSNSDVFVAKLTNAGALTWNTFLGGTGNDAGRGIAVDAGGNVYVGGYSGVSWGTPLRAFSGSSGVLEGLVAKLTTAGVLTWHSFLGGTGVDEIYGLALDSEYNIYLAGYSNITWGTPIQTHTGGDDILVVKLSNSGSLLWNTFMGGSSGDIGYSVAVDASGNIYGTGSSSATWGSPVRSYTAGIDACVFALNNGGSLSWNTFLGGTGSDIGFGIALGNSGGYVASYSSVTWGSPLQAFSGQTDGFLAKFDVSSSSGEPLPSPGFGFWGQGNTFPEWGFFDGTNWGATGFAPSMLGAYRIIQGAYAPTRDEVIIMGVINTGSSNVVGQMWNGSSLSTLSLNPYGSVAENTWWSTDVAYEQVSGEALIVAGDGTSLKSSSWNGTTWCCGVNISAGTPKQMKLASKPGSDEIVLVYNTPSGDYARVWNGSSWGNFIALYEATQTDFTDINVAYEQVSGRAMVVYAKGFSGDDTHVYYRIWDGTSWSAEGVIPSAGASSTHKVKWTTLAAQPGSNRIALGVQMNFGSVSWLNVWNGSSWNASSTQLPGSRNSINGPNLEIAFEENSGEGLLVYGTALANTLFYRTLAANATTWSAEYTGPAVANSNTIRLYPRPGRVSDQIMLMVQDGVNDVHSALWDGNLFGASSVREPNSGETRYQPFDFMWKGVYRPDPPLETTASGHYIIQVDTLSFPPNSTLTSDNLESAVFTGGGEISCSKNFGLSTHLPPFANPDTAYVDAGISAIINVIGNDYDPEGTPLTMTILTNPPNGTAVNNQNGSLTFTPNGGFTGWQTFTYQVCDQGTPSLCDTTTVSVLVSAFANNRPEAQDDYDTTYVNTPVETDLVFNDFDAEFDNLTVSLSPGILQPANGTLLIISEHEIEYIPNPGFTGNDSYRYIVCDDRSPALCDTARVYIHVRNNPPDAKNDLATTEMNVAVPVNVLVNDSEPDGHQIILMSGGTNVTNGQTCAGGAVSVNNNGTPANPADDVMLYSPQNGFAGLDTFFYRIQDSGSPTGYDTARVIVNVTPLIDLELHKTVNPPVTVVGQNVTFTLTLTNEGPGTATSVLVEERLTNSYAYVSDNGMGTYDPVSGMWYISNLGPGQTISLNLTATILNSQNLKNVAQVYRAEQKDIDSRPANDDGNQSEDDEDSATPLVNEICNDGLDNDGDGLTDCADSDCGIASVNLTANAGWAVCLGSSTTLTAMPTGGISPYSYAWSNGLGSGASKTVSPAITTTYTVTVTTASGCTGTGQANVTVMQNPVVNAGADVSVCQGFSTTLMATGSGGSAPYFFAWSNGLGSGASKTITPSVTATYTVTVTDANGCTGTDQVTVTVNHGADVTTSPNITICSGSATTISASASGGVGPYTFQWNQGLGAGDSKMVNPLVTTNYTVTVTTSLGCTSTGLVTVTVNETPIANAGPDVTICSGSNTTLTASAIQGGAPYTYAWSDGLGSGASTTVSPGTMTTYTVTVTSANSCTSVDQVTVFVASLPAANAGQDVSICPGASTSLTATGSGGTAPYTFNWNNGLGAGASKTVSPIANTTYTVTVTDTNGCTSTDQVQVLLHSPPAVSADPDTTICTGWSAILTATAAGGTGPYSFNWNNGLGSGSTKTVNPLVTTSYTVTVTDANGCTSTDIVAVTVFSCTEICDNGLDDDGDGLIDCDDPECAIIAAPLLGNDTFGICPGKVYTDLVIFNDGNYQSPLFSIATNPVKGSVTINSSGAFTYTPYYDFCSTDQFVYQVCNQATGCCSTATVLLNSGDQTPPQLLNVPADITISCDDAVPVPPIVLGIDGCPGIYVSLEENSTALTGAACKNYTITRTWTATDLCDNSISASQVITVEDATAPEIFRVYTLANGRKVMAGVSKTTSTAWKKIWFPVKFNQTPLVFSQVISENDAAALTVQQRNVSIEGFDLRMREEENADNQHPHELVAWLAIEPGSLTDAGNLQAGSLSGVNHLFKTIHFAQLFSVNPCLITSAQTTSQADPFSIQTANGAVDSIQIRLVEETSKDLETSHSNETVGYLAMEPWSYLRDEYGNSFGETGTVAVSHVWTTVNLGRTYNKPVVLIGSLPSSNGPATIRVKNVTATSFQVSIQEWDYLDGTYPLSTISYLVAEGSVPAETGNFCLQDGSALQPGVNLYALDNCDNQVALDVDETTSYNASGLTVVRSWTATDDCGNLAAISRTDTCAIAAVRLNAMLNGATINNGGGSLMRDDLRKNGLIPLTEPYSGLTGFQHTGIGGGETMDSSILTVEGPNAIVDWVFIEVRDPGNESAVLATCAALLQRDGQVVTATGDSILMFPSLVEGDYYVAIRHRNHLGIMAYGVNYLSTSAPPLIDFTQPSLEVNGENAAGSMAGGKRKLWSGDLNGDRKTIYQGPSNDVFRLFSHVLEQPGNTGFIANFISIGYYREDLNMDGKVIYQGPNNDRATILQYSTLVHPGNLNLLANFIVLEKLP